VQGIARSGEGLDVIRSEILTLRHGDRQLEGVLVKIAAAVPDDVVDGLGGFRARTRGVFIGIDLNRIQRHREGVGIAKSGLGGQLRQNW